MLETQNLESQQHLFHTPRPVSKGAHYAFSTPTQRLHYKPLLTSERAVEDLGLSEVSNKDDQMILSGGKLYCSANDIFPYSMNYAGFQFGSFAGQLGDGRVHNLFDVRDSFGNWQTLQLKGSGMTPFSRHADGKALVRSSIREFIISESLHHIGIPSTRALQLTSLPGTFAFRGKHEPCAVVCRYAPSWIRIGHFDIYRWKFDLKSLLRLADYCIAEVFNTSKNTNINWFDRDYFPDAKENITIPDFQDGVPYIQDSTKYDILFRNIVKANAKCVAYWQAYGFTNGVLNTDNTSILGLSMDFGPFSFMDKYDPRFTPNHDDYTHRYSFENQPEIIWWNLLQLAQSMAILLGSDNKLLAKLIDHGVSTLNEQHMTDITSRANAIVKRCAYEYKLIYNVHYAHLMAKRLGINFPVPNDLDDRVKIERLASQAQALQTEIINPLLQVMITTKIDFNNLFVNLQDYKGSYFDENSPYLGLDPKYINIFFDQHQVAKLEHYMNQSMTNSGLRNDSGETRQLLFSLETLQKWTQAYTSRIARKPLTTLRGNPLFTPRNWIFDQVIDDLTMRQREALNHPNQELDLSMLQKLYLMSSYPYDRSKWNSKLRPDLEHQWASLEHDSDEGKFMRQGTCSS